MPAPQSYRTRRVASTLVTAIAAVTLAPAAHASAQSQSPGQSQAQSQTAAPSCDAPEHREFDFWLGDWTVVEKGKAAGVNRITREEKGCILHEHWTGAQGGSGQSFNYYNREDKRWHQVWIDNGGNVLQLSGRYRDGALRYTGETVGQDGKPVRHRLTFFKNADGTVRQWWESSPDGGKSWQTAFDGLYRKKSS